jgi:uncharacterized SAM-binding protein YcdF (DUF218 family)
MVDTSSYIVIPKRRTQRAIAVGLMVIAILIVLHPVLLPPLAQVLVVGDSPQKADAIVVLGGGSGEREEMGAKLYAQGLADVVFTTGGSIPLPGMKEQTWAALSAVALERLGVPAEKIIQIPDSTSTCDDARLSYARLPAGAKRVMIVTDPYHTRRAKWLFGIGAPNMQVIAVADDLPWFNPQTWWQNEQSLIVVEQEYIKFVVNFVKGC